MGRHFNRSQSDTGLPSGFAEGEPEPLFTIVRPLPPTSPRPVFLGYDLGHSDTTHVAVRYLPDALLLP